MSARAMTSRPLVYQPRGGSPFRVAGTLARPAAEELIGGLDQQQRIFLAPWLDFVDGSTTEPEKYDGVIDPGPLAQLHTVAEASPGLGLFSVKLADRDEDFPVVAGWRWTAYNLGASAWQTGTVDSVAAGTTGILDLLPFSSIGMVDSSILFYPEDVREFSVHNISVLYSGAHPRWVRAEVTG